MFNALAHVVVRRRKSTLIIFLLVVFAAGGIGSLAFSKMDSGGYSNPKSESAKAARYLTAHFHVKDPGIVLVVDSGSLKVSDPNVAASATRLEAQVRAVPGVAQTLSYWSTGEPPSLQSSDGKAAYIFVYTQNTNFGPTSDVGRVIQSKFDGQFESLHVYASGAGVIAHAINSRSQRI